ncbi:MAG: cytochrome c [Bacteroidia bacterium]|nr:cytochrome c [Bacteroidia bacterium]MBP7259645.1 cytochrome c [Bacteroidia bacterium]MBP9179342.1 cytochrome c [Bacteroidia bacterium]MBP9723404.1 cytochrome c [Bacteroidia bacterium]
MKKVLKWIGIIALLFVVIITLGALYIGLSDIPTYAPVTSDFKADITPERVMNGQRIASMLCVQCHAGEDGKLTGKLIKDIPAEFGKVYSKNITHHHEAGIGKWTDGELYVLLRTGLKPDGKYLPPYMPKFPLVADEDLKDIIAWLRSDGDMLQAAENEAPDSEPSFVTKLLCRVAFKPLPMPEQEIKRPDTNDLVALGKYIVDGQIACFACHSKDFKTMNVLEPTKSEGYCGGGNPLLNLSGEIVPSSNITMDKETGIGNYTEEQFINAVKYNKKTDGTLLRYPMVPHSALTDHEVRAIFAYLKTVPVISNKVQ